MSVDRNDDSVTKPIRGGRIDYQIVEAIAEATDQEPMELPPLYESVDLDALEAIAVDRDDEVSVTFEHCGVTVIVGDGTITVEQQ